MPIICVKYLLKEDSDEVPYFPNSFQKASWEMSNFTPLIPYDVFWKSVYRAFDLSEHLCNLNLDSFNASAKKAYYDLYYT